MTSGAERSNEVSKQESYTQEIDTLVQLLIDKAQQTSTHDQLQQQITTTQMQINALASLPNIADQTISPTTLDNLIAERTTTRAQIDELRTTHYALMQNFQHSVEQNIEIMDKDFAIKLQTKTDEHNNDIAIIQERFQSAIHTREQLIVKKQSLDKLIPFAKSFLEKEKSILSNTAMDATSQQLQYMRKVLSKFQESTLRAIQHYTLIPLLQSGVRLRLALLLKSHDTRNESYNQLCAAIYLSDYKFCRLIEIEYNPQVNSKIKNNFIDRARIEGFQIKSDTPEFALYQYNHFLSEESQKTSEKKILLLPDISVFEFLIEKKDWFYFDFLYKKLLSSRRDHLEPIVDSMLADINRIVINHILTGKYLEIEIIAMLECMQFINTEWFRDNKEILIATLKEQYADKHELIDRLFNDCTASTCCITLLQDLYTQILEYKVNQENNILLAIILSNLIMLSIKDLSLSKIQLYMHENEYFLEFMRNTNIDAFFKSYVYFCIAQVYVAHNRNTEAQNLYEVATQYDADLYETRSAFIDLLMKTDADMVTPLLKYNMLQTTDKSKLLMESALSDADMNYR